MNVFETDQGAHICFLFLDGRFDLRCFSFVLLAALVAFLLLSLVLLAVLATFLLLAPRHLLLFFFNNTL